VAVVSLKISYNEGMLLQIDEIYLEAPSNIRLEQWLNTDMESGMSQFKFQLLDEPEMGTYTIVMKKGEADVRTTFVVEEYGEYSTAAGQAVGQLCDN